MELPAKIFSRLFRLPAIIQPAKIFPGCFSFAGCYGALKAYVCRQSIFFPGRYVGLPAQICAGCLMLSWQFSVF
jgi:hypothetical protein